MLVVLRVEVAVRTVFEGRRRGRDERKGRGRMSTKGAGRRTFRLRQCCC
jgi:hypothetical protein